jgi:hypothetical protein
MAITPETAPDIFDRNQSLSPGVVNGVMLF